MSYTSPLFHLRGDSLNAYVSHGGKVPAQFLSDASTPLVAVTASADTGAFGGSVLAKASTTKVRALAFPGMTNLPATPAFSLLMRMVPRFTGAPLFATGIVFFEGIGPGAASQGLALGITTSGALNAVLKDKYGTVYLNASSAGTYTAFASGTAVDIMIVWDGTTANLAFYVNGTLVGTITPSAGSPVLDRMMLGNLMVGMSSNGVIGNYDINEFAIWDSALSGADITALSARAAWIASTAFDGQSYVDPTPAGVKIGTAYTFAGVAKTGTYDGSDRWSDPGLNHVSTGITYLANGTLLTGVQDEPNPSIVKAGIVYDNSTKTGTYDGSDRWSDPGAAHVKAGVSYLAAGTSQVGSLQTVSCVLTGPELDPAGIMAPGRSVSLELTQGDEVDIALVCKGLDLSTATFSTLLAASDGTIIAIPNGQHTPDSDQITNRGKVVLHLTAAQTNLLKIGKKLTIIMAVSVGIDVIHFRGDALLEVKSADPNQGS